MRLVGCKAVRPAIAALVLLAVLGCSREGATRGPVDGFVLISLSGLRADALGFQGRRPSVTPFLDRLAERALIYERAYTTSPDTLAAHVSLMSGLYPAEHRVTPPERALSAEVPVLAELFGDFGFRTAGFTAGGYVSSDYGFDRGFDRFLVSRSAGRSPFDRAERFLRKVKDDRFFVFVHTDSIEQALMTRFDLRRLAAGAEPVTAELGRTAESSYLEAVAHLDRELESFFEGLEAIGLTQRTVIAVTADHGFEVGEHGRIGHSQVYPETLAVPLMVLGPGIESSRSRSLAQIVDIAPSFLALAELPTPPLSGVVLPGLGARSVPAEPRTWAVGEVRGRVEQKTLVVDREGSSHQVVDTRFRSEHDGTWVTRGVTFDTDAERLDFSVVGLGERRSLRLVSGGEVESEFEIGSKWSRVSLPLAAGSERKRLTLESEGCASPTELGMGPDRRCLSFKVRGLDLARLELFDLETDPEGLRDSSWQDPGLAAGLSHQLDEALWRVAPAPGPTTPRPAALAAITVRGEYPEPPHP